MISYDIYGRRWDYDRCCEVCGQPNVFGVECGHEWLSPLLPSLTPLLVLTKLPKLKEDA